MGQLDPARLAECARGLAVGQGVRRTGAAAVPPGALGGVAARSSWTDWCRTTRRTASSSIGRNSRSSACPTRAPDDTEAALLDQLALALIEFGTDDDLIALVTGDDEDPHAGGRRFQPGAGTHAAENT